MKKYISLFLTLCFVFAFASACGKKAGAEPDQNSLIGVWTIDSTNLKKAPGPITDALVNLLDGYISSSDKIEFKEGGKAVIGDSEIDYTLEGKNLTLTWDSSQNFLLNAIQNGDELNLNFQDHYDIALKKINP
ncbi:MAG: hypothetical protein IJT38_00965 [Clostridia bacterium]|nr:hypothetical protein [Clostridia bacterium]